MQIETGKHVALGEQLALGLQPTWARGASRDDVSLADEQERTGLGLSANLAFQPKSSDVVSGSDLSWPWQPEPRHPPLNMVGDLDGAIAFGLANGLDELRNLTSLLGSVIPVDVDCTANWSVQGKTNCSIDIDHPEFKLHQTFHRVGGELEVEYGLLELPRESRRRGYVKRLFRNLTFVFGTLGVQFVRAYANDEDGSIAWAKLGARPIDANQERDRLLTRLAAEHEHLGIGEEYLEGLVDVITNSPDNLLMRRLAAAVGDNGEPLGEWLLKYHSWEAYWDLHDPELRSHLRKVVG